MAQSEKLFRETLCESRSYAVETTDPAGARTIDELRRQVKELRTTLEGEKVKYRETVREHEKQLHQLREEEARRLDAALEACAMRKEQEKTNELKKSEERMERQKDHELKMLKKEKTEELIRNYRKWQTEKNEAIRTAVEAERRQSLEEFQASSSFSEEEAQAREAKLTREVFILGEQNDSLEQRVRDLSRLSRKQIDQMRRMKQECEMKVEAIVRQHKTEASREVAQLKLAEQIIAEKEHTLHAVEYRADMALMEKEALEEEIATMKSVQSINTNTSYSSFLDTSQSETSTPVRRSTGGGGVLQKRVEELETHVKKLEEEKANLKQDNASLRKRLLHDDGEKKTGSKVSDEKVKIMRKKNAELMALTKELDDRIKTLKSENDQLQKTKSVSVEADQQSKKALARQHVKDISEYTKQIHAKDRELIELRKKTAKLEAAAAIPKSEPAPELEKKVRSMAMEKLHMEKLIAKLYSRLPDVVDVEDLSRKDVITESDKVEQLVVENQTLHSQIQELQRALSQASDEVDKGNEVTRAALQQQREELLAENERLKGLTQSASKLDSECTFLRQKVDHLENINSSLEQERHELSQKLKISTLAVKELEGSQEMSAELEKHIQDLRGQLKLKEEQVTALEMESQDAANQLKGKQAVISTLQKQVEVLEDSMKEREERCTQLQASLDDIQSRPAKRSPTADIGTQMHRPEEQQQQQQQHYHQQQQQQQIVQTRTHPKPDTTSSSTKRFGKERIKSPVKRSLRSSHSPRTSSGDLLDSSLDNEMRAAGVDVNDSFDSSEGVGFSDTNLDTSVVESDHSLAVREEGEISQKKAGPKIAWDEKEHTDQAQAINGRDLTTRVGGGEGGEVEGQDMLNSLVEGVGTIEVVEESTGGGGGQFSSGSDGELVASPSHDRDSDESHTPHSDSGKVCIYIAKYSYNPSEMSPNQNSDLELPLTAGDYLYVYGNMDNDGFYHGQLMSGESGMIPSNFIERVMDEEESDGGPQSHKLQKRRGSHLQDIEEVDEDLSSRGIGSIPPPLNVMLERQFVDEGQYTVAIKWEMPHPLPEGVTGYCVYVNGELHYEISEPDRTSVLLTGIPRKQLVKISVRTCTEEGESSDPTKLIILNPQYPEAPTGVKVSLSTSPCCLMVQWTPSAPLKEGNAIDGYTVYINNHLCIQLGSNPTPVKMVFAQIFETDLRDFKDQLLREDLVTLTVCAASGDYLSVPSEPVVVAREDLLPVCNSGKMTADESEITSSATSLSSIDDEEEKEMYSPAQRLGKGVVTNTNGVSSSPPANGTLVEEPTEPVKYYKALANYDPRLQSPNEESAAEELAFHEDDIIIGMSVVDEDGFLIGKLNNETGYVPSNLVEEITDQQVLSQIGTILHNQSVQGQTHHGNMNGNQRWLEEAAPHKMKAIFDYDPPQDSPNENSEVELTINEGDILTVFGTPDDDGFLKAELAGKTGLVPQNFLVEMTPPPRNDEIEVFAADEESMIKADAIIQPKTDSLSQSRPKRSEKGSNPKRKGGGIFSRGKNILTKSIGKRGE